MVLVTDWEAFFGSRASGGVAGAYRLPVAVATTGLAWALVLRPLFPSPSPLTSNTAASAGLLLGTLALAYAAVPLVLDDAWAERRRLAPHYTSHELRWTRFRPYDGGNRDLRGARVDGDTGVPIESRTAPAAGPGPGPGIVWYWDDNAIGRHVSGDADKWGSSGRLTRALHA